MIGRHGHSVRDENPVLLEPVYKVVVRSKREKELLESSYPI